MTEKHSWYATAINMHANIAPQHTAADQLPIRSTENKSNFSC
jgi:hypothetical protein